MKTGKEHARPATVTAPVRVAVWGLGNHARKNILGALAACPDTALAGVCTRRRDVACEEAERRGCQPWDTDAEMLSSQDVDAVFVSTPIGLHYEHGLRVLKAGKHLWMEKPFAATAGEAEDLLALSRDRALAACEGFMYLWHPQFARLRELVHAENFGPIVSITCRFGMPRLEYPGFRTSKELGGSALLDVGCYPVSAALGLLGDAGFEVLGARLRTPEGSEVDEDGAALLQFSSGASAHLEWGFGRAYRNEIMVWGENASVYSDRIFSKPATYEARFLIRDRTGEVRKETLAPANAFVEMFRAFARMRRDEGLAERERGRIARQAEALDRIRTAGS